MLSYRSIIDLIKNKWRKVDANPYARRLILVAIMLGIAMLVLIGFKSRMHSFYFQDETDHVTVGWMMWRFDRQLYQDLSTNHMPVPILLGSFLSQIISFNSLFQLVSALRQSMWLIWTLCAVFATWRFRSAGAVTFTFLLLLNFYYFGFHVLTDPLGAMCVAIMTLYLVMGGLYRKELSNLDGLIFGLSAGLAWFSILSLWPFILMSTLIIIWCQSWRFRLTTLIGLLTILIFIFSLVIPVDWWRETVINNIYFVMPDQANFSFNEKIGILLLPLTVLTNPGNHQSVLIFGLFMFVVWLWSRWWRQSLTSNRKKIFISLIALLLLISLNARVPHSIYVFYRGIHLLPYLAGLTGLLGGLLFMIRPTLSQSQRIAVYAFTLFLITFSGRFMYEKVNQMNEYFIQYNEYESTGVALGRIKNETDTLMTGPDGYGFINQISDIPLFGKQNFHLSWSYYVPYLHDYFFSLFAENPPTFIFFRPGGDPHYQKIMPQLKSDYVRLKRQTSTSDIEMYELYILKSEINNRSIKQWQGFQDMGFLIPEEFKL